MEGGGGPATVLGPRGPYREVPHLGCVAFHALAGEWRLCLFSLGSPWRSSLISLQRRKRRAGPWRVAPCDDVSVTSASRHCLCTACRWALNRSRALLPAHPHLGPYGAELENFN